MDVLRSSDSFLDLEIVELNTTDDSNDAKHWFYILKNWIICSLKIWLQTNPSKIILNKFIHNLVK